MARAAQHLVINHSTTSTCGTHYNGTKRKSGGRGGEIRKDEERGSGMRREKDKMREGKLQHKRRRNSDTIKLGSCHTRMN